MNNELAKMEKVKVGWKVEPNFVEAIDGFDTKEEALKDFCYKQVDKTCQNYEHFSDRLFECSACGAITNVDSGFDMPDRTTIKGYKFCPICGRKVVEDKSNE